MHLRSLLPCLAVRLGAALLWAPFAHAQTPPSCPPILQHTFRGCKTRNPKVCASTPKVVLVVNTASFCGFTPQYKGLEALDSKYRARGLVVLGFPSNDFSQESGSNKDIADFCESTFGVKFPMFAKSSVRGPEANALFRQLAQVSGTTPKWNFYKYLIGRDGKVIESYSSMTAPDDRAFVRELQKQLGSN